MTPAPDWESVIIMHGIMQASQQDVLACLRSLKNLRQLTAQLELTSDTLAALVSLTALTKLHVMALYPMVSMGTMCVMHASRLRLPLIQHDPPGQYSSQ